MATAPTSPLLVSHEAIKQVVHESVTPISTVYAPSAGVSGKVLATWLQDQQKSEVELVRAAWAISLRSYTGSDDVSFRCLSPNTSWYCHVSPLQPVRTLFDARLVDSVEEKGTRIWAANSVVYESEGQEDASNNFDIGAYFWRSPDAQCPDIGIGIQYNPSVISADLAEMVAATAAKAVEEIVLHSDSLIEALDICSDADITRLSQWNSSSDTGLTPAQCIHHFISEKCAAQPESIAVLAWDGEVTYGELDRLSSALAVRLQDMGVRPETFVPLVFDKSKWAVVALLGVLKAGGAYFFLNPTHPIDYSRGLCSSLSPEVALCSPRHRSLASSFAGKVLELGEENSEFLRTAPIDTQPQAETSSSNAMYITFTSGTTGAPKGITTEHSAFYHMALANGKKLNVTPATRMLQFASYTFDVSNRDMLITLMFGGRICIPCETERVNDLAGFINRYSVNLASLTPSMASTLTPAACPSLEGLVLGGEPMNESHISAWAEHVRLFNAYGVSESTGIAMLADIKPGSTPGNIGFGCGSTIWVVAIDQPDKLAPIGALGELVIEGPSVARGYLGLKERTEKQFKAKPEWKRRILERVGDRHPGQRAFHTGDLVRYNLDGSLHLVGRRDHQVKVNGQRLELGAVEQQVAAWVEVAKSGFPHTAVVAVKGEGTGSTKLVAFLGRETPRGPNVLSQTVPEKMKDGVQGLTEDLKRYLAQCLPTYMVPAEFIFLQHMPLTPSGKVNRVLLQNTAAQELLEKQKSALEAPVPVGDQIPTTPNEKILVQFWAKALGTNETSIARSDCFFKRGGDSIAAIKMAARLREQGFVISVSEIFKSSTLSAMASVLVQDGKNSPAAAPVPFSLLSKPQVTVDAVVEETGLLVEQIEDVYPCTHMQQGLISLTAQDSNAYIGSYSWQLASTLDVERFRAAWEMAWLNHPILRTRVVQIPAGMFQVVVRSDMPWKTVTDVDECGGGNGSTEIDINQGPLVRFYLSKESFRLDIHHALYDEWSLDLIVAQVELAYDGEKIVEQPFSPFVKHLLVHGNDTATDDFWRQEFSGLEVVHLPNSASREANTGSPNDRVVLEHSLQVDAELSTSYTLSSILRLAWAIVLWHQMGSADVVFGATVSGRNANVEGIHQLSGPTLATLPVRIKLPTDRPIRECLAQVQDQFVNMMVHEQTGLSRIRQSSSEAAEACDFQNLLVVQAYEQQQTATSRMFRSSSGAAASAENAKAFASYPLMMTCRPEKGRITFKAAFDPALVETAAGNGILRQMAHVVQQLLTSDTVRVVDIGLMPPEDMAMLRGWNSLLPEPVDVCIHETIRKLCIAQPEALAIHSSDLDLTYAQVEDYSNRFALRLQEGGAKQGEFIPLLVERSPWVPVIILAVLKTGAAFVLLDLVHPIQRMRTMCSKVNATMLVSFAQHSQTSDSLSLPVIVFDPKAYTQPGSGPAIPFEATLPNPDAPACVVFSSGSTGLPKGIVLPHRAIATSAAVMRDHGMLAPTSRVFHFASFAFDISIGEILFTLGAGACICVPREEDRKGNPSKAAGDLQATWALLTPSVINLFDPADVPTLEVLGSCGEVLTQQIVDAWAHRLKLFAMYAPAECTVICHIARILPDTHASNIGWSPGAVSWIADPLNHSQLVPIGTVGELIVEGPVVASGYINDLAKTEEVFIASPPWLADFRPSGAGRLYKTGDLARQTSDGSLLFLGRKDDQVKLHGQRLEVGEVEHCITSVCTAVKTATVECIKIPEQNNRVCLVAFLAPLETGDWGESLDQESSVDGLELVAPPNERFFSTIETLDTSLRELLPAYMVPSFFVPLRHVPLSLSGKVNRRLLREQSASWLWKRLDLYQLRTRTTGVAVEDVPVTAHGLEVQKIMAQVLNLDVDSVPMNSNFFGLGGDSISAMRAAALARRRGIRLLVADIFTHQVLSKIASACDTESSEDTSTASGSHSSSRDLSASDTNSSQSCGTGHDKLPSGLPQEIIDNVEDAVPATEFQAMTLHNFYSRYLWISLPDTIDRQRLVGACEQLVQKHSVFRTIFRMGDDKSVVQLILRKVCVNLTGYQDVQSLEQHCAADSLAQGIPTVGDEQGFQVQFLTLKDASKFLVLRMSHAQFDGMSMATICDDLAAAYAGTPLAACAQFSDHTRGVSEKTTPEAFQVWRDVLRDATMTGLDNKLLRNWEQLGENMAPTGERDSEQPTVVTASTETAPISPPPNTTLATLAKVAWAVTLSRLFTSAQKGDDGCQKGTSDVVFGQVVHGRGVGILHEDRVVGPCLNIVPVRVHFPSPACVKHDLLAQVQQQHIQTMPVQNLGLGAIASHCTAWAPGTKFGSFVRFQNFNDESDQPTCCFDGKACATGLYSLPNRPSSTANVLIVPAGPTLTITMTVSSHVLDQRSADFVVGYFSNMIRCLASDEELSL